MDLTLEKACNEVKAKNNFYRVGNLWLLLRFLLCYK